MKKYQLGLTALSLFAALIAPALAAQTASAQSSIKLETNTHSLKSVGLSSLQIRSSLNAEFARSFRTKQAIQAVGATTSAKAEAFLNQHARSFGYSLSAQDFKLVTTIEKDETGMSHARYQQMIGAVPVTGSYIYVHMKEAGVSAVSSSVISDDMSQFNVTPSVNKSSALASASALVETINDADGDSVKFSEPRLEVFNFKVLSDRNEDGRSTLTWFVEAKAPGLRESIWVNAVTSEIHHHLSQITHGRNRLTYDSEDTGERRRTLVRTETSAPSGNAEIDAAHDFAGDVYDYYLSEHARDSYDGAGADIISSLNNSNAFRNAFWDGDEMIFGMGFATDDIVAHEFTHGVIEQSADLIYQGESGALNESYADIFGETVDLGNRAGNDAPEVKWVLGEDLSGETAIRNMIDPGMFNQPARVLDPNYDCALNGAGGSVHTNSGVHNHAFALMTDGGVFNGQTVNGIGLQKAAKINYRALTVYLGPSSNLRDNYTAVNQSCEDLIGVDGITAQDCNEVKKSLDSVEMNTPVCFAPKIADCPANQPREQTLLEESFEMTEAGNWINNDMFGDFPTWGLCEGSGRDNVYCTSDPFTGTYGLRAFLVKRTNDDAVEMSGDIKLPANTRLRFMHKYDIAPEFGGAVIEFSVDSGNTWQDANSLIEDGLSYNNALDGEDGDKPLAGRDVFSGRVNVYSPTILNLSKYAGRKFKLRFRVGIDGETEGGTDIGDGWKIDDISVYQCKAQCTNYVIKAKNGNAAMVCL